MSVYGFDEYKNKVLLSDMVPTDVPVPSVLADGSVIYYDRGSNYGQYNLTDGVITRVSDGMDNGSPSSSNWRFLIISQTVYSGIRISNVLFTNENNIGMQNGWEKDIGYGYQNTNNMLEMAELTATNCILPKIHQKRQNDGYNWFIPAGIEVEYMFLIKNELSKFNINLLTAVLTSNIKYQLSTQDYYSQGYGEMGFYNGYNISILDDDLVSFSGYVGCVPLVRRI